MNLCSNKNNFLKMFCIFIYGICFALKDRMFAQLQTFGTTHKQGNIKMQQKTLINRKKVFFIQITRPVSSLTDQLF